MESEKEELIEDEKQLKELEEAKYTSKITAKRGRLIRKLKSLKKRIEKKGEMTPEVNELLNKIDSDLSEQILKHKSQLKIRYNEEFLQAEAKVPDVITTLPKGIGLQFKRVLNCINEVKQSKTKKAKALGMMNVGKQLGLLLATPVIFAGKFIVEHWYLLLLLLQFDKIDDLKNFFKKQKNSNNQEINQQHQEVPVESAEKVSVKKPLLNPEVKQYEKPYVNIPVNNIAQSNADLNSVINVFKDAGYDVINSSLVDTFLEMLRESGLTNGVIYYKNIEEAASQLGIPSEIANQTTPSFARNLNVCWVIGPGGLFENEQAFLEIMSSNYNDIVSLVEANPELFNMISEKQSIGLNNAFNESFGNLGNSSLLETLKNTGTGLTAIYLIYKLGQTALIGPAALASPF